MAGSQREQRQRHLVCRARPDIGRDHRGRQGRLQDADQAKPPGPGARHGAGVPGARGSRDQEDQCRVPAGVEFRRFVCLRGVTRRPHSLSLDSGIQSRGRELRMGHFISGLSARNFLYSPGN